MPERGIFRSSTHATDIRKDKIYRGIFCDFVHIDDEVIVAGIITGSAGELLDIVLAHLIDLIDEEPRLFFIGFFDRLSYRYVRCA